MTTISFRETKTISLTAQITSDGDGVSIQYEGTHYHGYKSEGLAVGTEVTLEIKASDGTTKLSGTYTPASGTATPFSTNDATMISQTFTAPTVGGTESKWSFIVATPTAVCPDPTLILQTKSGGSDDVRG